MLIARIAEWIESQQPWLSDAARRLFVNGRIEPAELEDILAMAKSSAGIDDAAGRVPAPLTRDMLPAEAPPGSAATILSLRNLVDVNAIVPGQSLAFARQGLTVVYGDNGSGKSGYSRVLRKACRARATGGPILGNVFAGLAALREAEGPHAEIEITHEGATAPEVLVWRQGQPSPPELASVAVFDSLCARAFNDAEGEIAYTPRGLDVLAGLADLCGTLRERLAVEIRAITASSVTFADLLGEHAVGRLLRQFDRRFDLPEYRQELRTLAELSGDELTEIERLAALLAEANPAQRAVQLRGTKARVEALAARWERCEEELGDVKLDTAKALGLAWVEANIVAQRAAGAFAAEGNLLPGTGSEAWRILFEAARNFSVGGAYAGHEFPHVDGARCVLCQQELGESASVRMRLFSRFVEQEAQKAADGLRRRASDAVAAIEYTTPDELTADGVLLEEIEQAQPNLADRLRAASRALAARKTHSVRAWAAKDFAGDLPAHEVLAGQLREVVTELAQRAAQFDSLAAAEARGMNEQRLNELKTRQQLATRLPQINQIAEDLSLKAKLETARQAADSGRISRKMQALHAEALSADAEAAFERECESLGVGHLPIVSHTRIERGAPMQRLQLDTVGAERIGEVLSEGEQRALALATFLSEVSLVPGHGGVVFDDPMSSLDHERRERVAQRLAEEALTRQVIVFTHDLAFANHLVDAAAEVQAPSQAMSIRRTRVGAGIVYPELPFAGMRIPERLDRIRQVAANAARAEADGDMELFETRIRQGYGRLRETWERIVEESILNKTVVRFRPGVATQSLRAVELSDDDYVAVHRAMARCSHFAAHDAAAADNPPIPSVDELRADIEVAAVFIVARNRLNQDTERRRRDLVERPAALR